MRNLVAVVIIIVVVALATIWVLFKPVKKTFSREQFVNEIMEACRSNFEELKNENVSNEFPEPYFVNVTCNSWVLTTKQMDKWCSLWECEQIPSLEEIKRKIEETGNKSMFPPTVSITSLDGARVVKATSGNWIVTYYVKCGENFLFSTGFVNLTSNIPEIPSIGENDPATLTTREVATICSQYF